jgi:hypothetical protein
MKRSSAMFITPAGFSLLLQPHYDDQSDTVVSKTLRQKRKTHKYSINLRDALPTAKTAVQSDHSALKN